MKTQIKIIFLLLVFLSIEITIAANHYVREGASGNGSGNDWTNAYTSLPGNLVRGDTYYIADGTYGGYNFDTNPSGSTYIYIMKATESAHGTNTGWNSSYGDGVAHFTNTLNIGTSYWVIDGVTGEGESGHGFKITTTSGGDSKLIRIMGGPSYITVAHTEMEHRGEDQGSSVRQDIFYVNGQSTNIQINYCWLHDVSRCHFILSSCSNITIDHCVIARNHNVVGSPHMQAIQGGPGPTTGIIIRHSIFYNISGTGYIVALDATHTNWEIYGCVFYRTDTRYMNSPETIGNTSGDTSTGMKVYNNSFVGLGTSGIRWNGGSNNEFYNNLVYNCSWNLMLGTAQDYNWYYGSGSQSEQNIQIGIADPFVDPDFHDYRLKDATNPGMTLPAPYDVDMDGNNRGEDGNWDRGAYEQTGASTGIGRPRGVRIKP